MSVRGGWSGFVVGCAALLAVILMFRVWSAPYRSHLQRVSPIGGYNPVLPPDDDESEWDDVKPSLVDDNVKKQSAIGNKDKNPKAEGVIIASPRTETEVDGEDVIDDDEDSENVEDNEDIDADEADDDQLNGTAQAEEEDGKVYEVAVTAVVCPKRPKVDERPGHVNGRPVQFIHVPKAGGTSVQDSLRVWSRAAGLSLRVTDGNTVDFNPSILHGVFVGHRGYGYSSKIKAKNPLTIVVLRDPVSRIVSLFDYMRTLENAASYLTLIRNEWRKMTLDEAIQSYARTRASDPDSLLPQGSASISDRTMHRVIRSQIQYLCGYECLWYMTGSQLEKNQPLFANSHEEDVARAKVNLERIDCVGVLERLDDLIIQLKASIDFVPKGVNAFPHVNVVSREKKSTLSKESRDLLKEWLEDEYDLYERAKQLNQEKTSRAAECLARERSAGLNPPHGV